MEPHDFDRIFKSKIEEGQNPHRQEMEQAKPFVWTAIQQEIQSPPKNNPWMFVAAAAILLLLLMGSFLVYQLDENHQKELNALMMQMEQLNQYQQSQVGEINHKESELSQLQHQLEALSCQLDQKDEESGSPMATVKWFRQVDTLYIEKVEYRYAEELDKMEAPPATTMIDQSELEEEQDDIPEISDGAIFPSYAKRQTNPKNEGALTVRLSTFSVQ